MSRQKKIAIMPRLHNYGGDISKQWFVFYSYRNPANDKMQRFRVYEGFAQCETLKLKTEYGNNLVKKLAAKIANGWSPFDQDEKVIYDNSLEYQQVALKYGRKREANKRFAYYTAQWLNQQAGIRPSTFTTYKSKLRYFNTYLEEISVDENDITEFTQTNAADFRIWLKRKRKLGHKSINEYNVLLKAFFKYLIEQKLLKENPFADFKPLKVESKKPRIYSPDLLEKISSHAAETDKQLLLVIRIIFNCFIRPNEIRQLTIADIDFTRGKIRVKATVAKDKDERMVDIPDYLLDYMISQGLNKYPLKHYLISDNEVPGPQMVSRNYLYRRMVKLKKRMGLPRDYVLYAFKHTGMVETKKSGADWLDIRNQAGHDSLDQTIEYTTALMAEGSKHIRQKGPRI